MIDTAGLLSPDAATEWGPAWWNSLSRHTEWARPLTFGYLVLMLVVGGGHWVCARRRAPFDARDVHLASATSSRAISPTALLLFRAVVFVWCFGVLVRSSFTTGPALLRLFTVWNFIALTLSFGLGTALSCSCCRTVAQLRPASADHAFAAALHHTLLEVQLTMSALVAAIVWLVIYPYDLSDDRAQVVVLSS